MTSKNYIFLLLALLALSCGERESKQTSIRKTEKFNSDWKFIKGDHASIPDVDDTGWETVNLPHDWSITEPYHIDNPGGFGTSYMIGGKAWYQKSFVVSAADEGKRIEITFDGVYQNSTVWLNGHLLGTRPFGYITFKYDLTPHILFGQENILTVRVDNSDQTNSRWYSGSGIYRNVWLTKSNKVYIDPWGTFITTPQVSESESKVNIKSEIFNQTTEDAEITVFTEIFEPGGLKIGEMREKILISPQSSNQLSQDININSPRLWSIENPNLYTLRQTIIHGNTPIDDYQTTFGIRYFEFDAQKGFILNGKPVKIKGVCMHHDLGALGAAINVRAMERQLEILKSMGCNGIRTAHNPPAPELLQLCDRMGFIVMNETFDEWKMPKTKFGYSVFWDEWHEKDLRDHILRDRNHPSVFIWSIGNEILEQWHPQGTEMATKLAAIVRELDPTRPITTGNNDPVPHNSIISSGKLDLIGYNYKHETYEQFHTVFPGQKFISTETTSALATRGSYDMPSDSIRKWPLRWDVKFEDGNPDNTCSAYDNCHAPWGSTHEDTWKVVKRNDYLTGLYVWTGFDYLGEPTPYQWPSRSSYFGIIDLAGFPKDIYYMYQSEWSDETVLHIFPHWNWKEDQVIDIVAYYNHADEVELFLNETSLGTKSKKDDDVKVMWRVPFKAGTLKAVSRLNGQEVQTREISTSGQAAQMKVTADRTSITSGHEDLSFVTIDILDEKGNLVPFASNLVNITIEGDVSIAGVDNGDPTSHHAFQGNSIKAFHGKCLVILRSSEKTGKAKITFSSEGLPDQVLEISVK